MSGGWPGPEEVAPLIERIENAHTALAEQVRGLTDDQVAELHAFGYTDREIVDVVGIVALNVLTGAFNLIGGLQPDPPGAAVTARGPDAQTDRRK